MAVWDEAVEREVREVQEAGYSESVYAAIDRGISLNERYGDDAERAFWEQVVESYNVEKD